MLADNLFLCCLFVLFRLCGVRAFRSMSVDAEKESGRGSIRIRHHSDRMIDAVRKQFQYDLHYRENRSIFMDFRTLSATIFVTAGTKGAHQ